MNENGSAENVKKNWQKPLMVVGLVVLVVGILAGGVLGSHYYYLGKTMPGQQFAGVKLGGMTSSAAKLAIKQRWQQLKSQTVTVSYGEQKYEMEVEELGFSLGAPEKSIEQIEIYKKGSGYLELVSGFLQTDNVPLYVASDRLAAELSLYDQFVGLEAHQNAKFIHDDTGDLIIAEAKAGNELAWEQFYQDVLVLFGDRAKPTLTVQAMAVAPTVTDIDLEPVREQFLGMISQPTVLESGRNQWVVNWQEQINLLAFEERDDVIEEGWFPFAITLDSQQWDYYADELLAPELDKEAENVELTLAADSEKVEFSANGADGQAIKRSELAGLVAESLNNPSLERTIEIPLDVVKGEVLIAQELQAMGITDLVTEGHTSYYGSPNNRRHNISVGLSTFSGLIIQPGEEFSFNKNLGPVEGYTGYLPELVIKPEGTIPEYGGGLCQVSTTMYRAVLNADLPVAERRPHSYAVSYYAQQLGHGLDATIYPGASDLKFTNTTGAPLVVQAYSTGYNAYFKFYGQPVGKTVSYDGPYISNRRGAPPTVEIFDASLAPGTRKQVEKPHAGFDVLWYKTITHDDGTEETKEIFSEYRAVPAKFLVGPSPTGEDPTAEAEAGATLEPVTGFSS